MADLFTEKAKDFDTSDRVKKLSAAVGQAILDNVPLHENMNVMDFGAGTGLISSHVAPLVNRITAVDISESMLARLVAKPELHGKVAVVCQDIMDKPLNEKFDLIMSAMALHHIQDTREVVKVFSAHLKQGAMLALADLDKEDGSFHPENTEGVFHAGFERDELETILEDSGFHDIAFTTAHTVQGETKDYPVFLVTATRQ